MTINFKPPEIKELKPRILVLGVGGAGGNAINGMIESGLQGVEFIAVNTDAQDLKHSQATQKIQIGLNLTKGLGAGSKLDIGQAAADESLNDILLCPFVCAPRFSVLRYESYDRFCFVSFEQI